MLISWNVTKACNLKCRHCYRDAGTKDSAELSLKEAKGLLAEVAEAGFKIIIFSGGEPLLREDICELISFSSGLGLRPVLGTNGVLMNREIIKKLKSAGLCRAGISLDSVEAKIHDDFRQKSGSWEATVEAMMICKDEGLEFQAHTTVMRSNYAEIEKITDFVLRLGACAHHIFFLVPTGRGKDISDFLLPQKDYQALLKRIMKQQKEVSIELKPVCAPQFVLLAEKMGTNTRFGRGCLAGISYCCILPNGDVHPCPYLPISVGNVRWEKFSRIWQDNTVFTKLRSLDYRGRCGPCAYKDSCGGCRARAWAESNDYMQEDPICGYAG